MNKFLILILLPLLSLMMACSEEKTDDLPQKPTTSEVEQNSVAFTYNAGLNVGATVPRHINVKLGANDTNLREILKDSPIVLLFNRSVDWCPYCQAQLKEVGEIVGDVEKRGYRILAVSYDDAEAQEKFLNTHDLNFQMLSDEGSALIDGFELRDPQYTEGRAAGVPYATIMVINRDGIVKAKSISGDHKKRPTTEQILMMIDSI